MTETQVVTKPLLFIKCENIPKQQNNQAEQKK